MARHPPGDGQAPDGRGGALPPGRHPELSDSGAGAGTAEGRGGRGALRPADPAAQRGQAHGGGPECGVCPIRGRGPGRGLLPHRPGGGGGPGGVLYQPGAGGTVRKAHRPAVRRRRRGGHPAGPEPLLRLLPRGAGSGGGAAGPALPPTEEVRPHGGGHALLSGPVPEGAGPDPVRRRHPGPAGEGFKEGPKGGRAPGRGPVPGPAGGRRGPPGAGPGGAAPAGHAQGPVPDGVYPQGGRGRDGRDWPGRGAVPHVRQPGGGPEAHPEGGLRRRAGPDHAGPEKRAGRGGPDRHPGL